MSLSLQALSFKKKNDFAYLSRYPLSLNNRNELDNKESQWSISCVKDTFSDPEEERRKVEGTALKLQQANRCFER